MVCSPRSLHTLKTSIMIERPAALFHAILLALLVSLLTHSDRLNAAERPNFLVLFADDQRSDTIAAYGNPHIRTPNIDRLVERGYSFRRNYCFGSLHGAVCVPSRAMLNSGRHYVGLPMDLEGVTTLPQLLGKSGYRTFGTGKWHNGKKAFDKSFQTGRAVFLGGMCDHLKVPIREKRQDGTWTDARRGEKFSSELFADAAISFLEEPGGEEPFYCYVAFTAPHDPRQPHGEFADAYDPEKLPLPENYLPQHPFDNGFLTGRDEALGPWPRTPRLVREQLAEYYELCSHMDAQVGRILRALEASGKAENTYIIYAADHGLAVGSHGLLGKQSLYEHSMGCPLIFVGPGIPKASSTRAFSYLFDVFPTVCDLAGVEAPEDVFGKGLRGIWEGKVESVRDSVYTMYTESQRAVRTDRWKLIVYPLVNRLQLFDLEKDPFEKKNLAEEPGQALRIVELTALLRDWQREVGDDVPLVSTQPKEAEVDLTGRKRRPDQHQPEWIVEKYFGEGPFSD